MQIDGKGRDVVNDLVSDVEVIDHNRRAGSKDKRMGMTTLIKVRLERMGKTTLIKASLEVIKMPYAKPMVKEKCSVMHLLVEA